MEDWRWKFDYSPEAYAKWDQERRRTRTICVLLVIVPALLILWHYL